MTWREYGIEPGVSVQLGNGVVYLCCNSTRGLCLVDWKGEYPEKTISGKAEEFMYKPVIYENDLSLTLRDFKYWNSNNPYKGQYSKLVEYSTILYVWRPDDIYNYDVPVAKAEEGDKNLIYAYKRDLSVEELEKILGYEINIVEKESCDEGTECKEPVTLPEV